MLIRNQTAYVQQAANALVTGQPFESLVDACRRQTAEEAAAKVVSFANWRAKLRPADKDQAP